MNELNAFDVGNEETAAFFKTPDPDKPEQPQGWALDPPYYEVELEITISKDKKKNVAARISPAKLGQEIQRENNSITGYKEVNQSEEAIIVKEVAPNAALFSQTCTHVKGFRLRYEDKALGKEWRELTAELSAAIPKEIKSRFIECTREVKVRYVDDDDDDCFIVGGSLLLNVEVEFNTGNIESPTTTVRFVFPESEETEREEFIEKASQLLQSKGEKKRTVRILSDVRECCNFLDNLLMRPGAYIDGGTVGGMTFEECQGNLSKKNFLSKIEPWLKVRIINEAFKRYNARLSDSPKP